MASAGKVEVKSFNKPEEVRNFPKGKIELVKVDGAMIGRGVFEPGWKCPQRAGRCGRFSRHGRLRQTIERIEVDRVHPLLFCRPNDRQPLFDRWLKGRRLVREVKSLRFLTPEVALMHVLEGTIPRGKSAPAPERNSIQTLVALKSGNEWRLEAFHNTRVRPIGRNIAGTLVWFFFRLAVETVRSKQVIPRQRQLGRRAADVP